MSGFEPSSDVATAILVQPANAGGMVPTESWHLAEFVFRDPHRCFDADLLEGTRHALPIRTDAANHEVSMETALAASSIFLVKDKGGRMVSDIEVAPDYLGGTPKLVVRHVASRRYVDMEERGVGGRAVAHELHCPEGRREVLGRAIEHLDAWA